MISEPTVGKAFFGRNDILNTLEKRVVALKSGYRQNVALTGPMLAGKSSILHQFLHTLKDASLVPVYIEVIEESFTSFAGKFIATLLYNYLVSVDKSPQKDLAGLVKNAESLIPHTISAIKKVQSELSKKNYTDAYRKLLNLTSVLKNETGKSCVVILDEFHNLEFLKIKKPYLYFGKIIMIQKDTMYIVSSSERSTIKKILSEKLDLLYGNFEIVEISGFDSKTAKAFLEEKLRNIGLSENYREYLIDFTDGNPFYLDVISKKIAEITNARKLPSADEGIAFEALTSLIYAASGTINQYFTNNIMSLIEKGLRRNYLEILIALASGCNKLKSIAAWFNKKHAADLSGKLAHLIELDIVYKNGSFYGIEDAVFKFWLRTVYHKKKSALVDDIVSGVADFREDLKASYEEYRSQSRLDALERIKELFLLFNGETVEIEKKKKKLPRFIKIERKTYGSRDDLLTCQKTDKYWICEICRDRVNEEAVSNFIDRYNPMKGRITKKICVALEGIDTNALLLAKEKNIWIWSLESVNTLLRLYKRHKLIYK